MILAQTAGGRVSLREAWNTFIARFDRVGGELLSLLTIVGVVILVFALVKWLWERRRGGGGFGSSSGLVWTVFLATLLVAPKVLIPWVLGLVDILVNLVIGIFSSS